MTTVILVRPGSTDFDEQQRIQGQLDLPLNDKGAGQVREIVSILEANPVELVLASPGEPARATANAIAEKLEVPVKILDGLLNLDQGLWQGLQVEDVKRMYPRVFKLWQESPIAVCPPRGETVLQALERVQKALEKPMRRKSSIALVLSEPLASLVAAVLRGAAPEQPSPLCGQCGARRVEIFEADRFDPAEAASLTGRKATVSASAPRGASTDEFREET